MWYFIEHVMIILCIVTISDSEKWYPATVATDQTVFDRKTASSLNDIPIRNYLSQYLDKYENITVNKSKWHFSHHVAQNERSSSIKSDPAKIIHEKAFPTTINQTSNTHQSGVSFEKVDGFRNTNNILPSRPKRRILKRCPFVQPRKMMQSNINQTKNGKFLEVFEVIQFDHVNCTSSSGLEGTCLHEYDCESAGGFAMGSCVDGYASCCVIQFVCDGRSSSSTGWFTNLDFPTPSTKRMSCTTTLDKSSADIEQIRLDFLIFEMLSPTSGTCEDDQFIVSGQNTNNLIPILCGINTGQHVYIEVGDVNTPIHLSVQAVSPEKRLFAIKVTQLTRSDELRAPKGCLQYYTGDNGYLESFNYRDNSDIGISRYPGYLNNLNYAMCIEKSPSSCSITYTNVGELQIPNYDTDGLPVIPPRQAGVEIFNCPSDWLLISAIRLCGERLNDGSILQDFSLDAPVTDNGAGPIVIWFRSDGGYVGRGFKLYYLQNTCSVSS